MFLTLFYYSNDYWKLLDTSNYWKVTDIVFGSFSLLVMMKKTEKVTSI